jgi:hypothetical protein
LTLASADGSRIAYLPVVGTTSHTVSPAHGSGPDQVVPVPVTGNERIVDLATGHSVGEIPPGDGQVLALSDDGSVVLTSRQSPTPAAQDGVRLVDVGSGRTVVSRLGIEAGFAVVDPQSGDFIVETSVFDRTRNRYSLGLLLVDPSGRWREMSTGFAPGEAQSLASLD